MENKKNKHKVPCQVLTKEEHKHEKILLGDLFEDKEFLRWFLGFRFFMFVLSRSVYKRATNNLDLKFVSEEGFLFLTDRSDFWRNQKPIYVTNDEKEKNALSRNKNVWHLKL